MVGDDRYDFASSVKQAQDQFSYHVKDADSRHNTPARSTARLSRSPERNGTQMLSATVGYDEKKQGDTSESVMDRMRNRITNRALNGTYSTAALTTDNAPAEEAKSSSLSRQSSYSSSALRANSVEDDDDIPPPPPPPATEAEPVAKSLEEKVTDRKSVAMNRVMARMSSRSASMKLDVEAPPPPPPPLEEPEVEAVVSTVNATIDSDHAGAAESTSIVGAALAGSESKEAEDPNNDYAAKEEAEEQEFVDELVYSYSEEREVNKDEEVKESYKREEASPARANGDDLSPSYKAAESFYIPTNFYDEKGAEQEQDSEPQQVHVSTSHTGIAELDAFPSNGSSDGLELKEKPVIAPETKQPVLSFREPIASVHNITVPDAIAAPASASVEEPAVEPVVEPAMEPAVTVLKEVPAVEEDVPEKEPLPSAFGVPHEFLVPPTEAAAVPVVEKESPLFVALPPVEVQSETPEPRSEGSSPVPSEGAAPMSAKERLALRMAKMKEAKK